MCIIGNIDRVQQQINYNFQNPNLLIQAFTTKSYSNEYPRTENCQVLEWVGDRVLSVFITKWLTDTYGIANADSGFHCTHNEGHLTDIKQYLEKNDTLAKQTDILGWSSLLRQGKGDAEQKTQEQDSVKADLFESVLGAVAIDSKWNYEVLQQVTNIMLEPKKLMQTYRELPSHPDCPNNSK